MGLTCNIDRKGRASRALAGGAAIALAAALASVVWSSGLGVWGWAMVTGLALLGAFGLFEAAYGWCAIRAMGFKTKV